MFLLMVGVWMSTAVGQAPSVWPSLAEPPAHLDRQAGASDAALIVGIEDYAFLPDVPGAAANAAAWHRFLRARGVPVEHLHVLVDGPRTGGGTPQATRAEILRRARRAADGVGPGGTLWIVFVGHGAPSRGGQALLLSAEVTPSVDDFEERGIPRRELLEALGRSARQAVVVLDACFTGQGTGGAALLDESLQAVVPRALLDEGARGGGALQLLATSQDEYAGPLPGASRPAFSYLVLGALRGWGDQAAGGERDGTVTAGEALAYAQDILGLLVVGRSQRPRAASEDPRRLSRPLTTGVAEEGPDLASLREAVLGSDSAGFGGAEQRGSERSPRKAKRGHPQRLVSGILGGIGVATVITTTLLDPQVGYGDGQRTPLVAANTLGWLATGTGGVWFATTLGGSGKRTAGPAIGVRFSW